MRWILGHDRDGDDDGNVVARFFGEYVAVVEFPEIGVSSALDGGLHGAWSRVVSGHGEIPVAELVVEILEMMRGGARGLFGILPIVNPPTAFESVASGATAHELPHAASAGARDGERMESGFGLGEVDEFLGNSLLAENAADHVFIAAGAGECAFEGAASAIGEVVDEAGDLIGHHERQVGVRGLDLGFGFGFDAGVDGRRDFVGFVDRSGLGLLLGESVALLEGGEFEAVDAVQNAVEFVLEAVVGLEVESAAEEDVEGGVETLLGGFEVSGTIVVLSRLVLAPRRGR